MKKTIYLAGGCFWGVEEYFSRLKGVLETRVGYANGTTSFPTYEEVKSQKTGHAETVKVVYESDVITLEGLLEHYLRFVDPFAIDRQGHDEGHQYRTGIYYTDLLDGVDAVAFLTNKLGTEYKIEVTKLNNFYPAEEYHQEYLKKNPGGYCHVNLNLIQEDEKK